MASGSINDLPRRRRGPPNSALRPGLRRPTLSYPGELTMERHGRSPRAGWKAVSSCVVYWIHRGVLRMILLARKAERLQCMHWHFRRSRRGVMASCADHACRICAQCFVPIKQPGADLAESTGVQHPYPDQGPLSGRWDHYSKVTDRFPFEVTMIAAK